MNAPTSLWAYQQDAVSYALRARRSLIALDMGGGKTVVALAALQQAEAFPAIVVCPAIMKSIWGRMIEQWLPGESHQIIWPGDEVEYGKSVYVVNYSLIDGSPSLKRKINGVMTDVSERTKRRSLKSRSLVESLMALSPRAVIADESSNLKNKKANRSKAMNRISRAAGLRLALTGTPVDNGPQDYISQLKFLDRLDEFGGEWMFKKRYCVKAHHTGDLKTCLQPTCKTPLKWKARIQCPGCNGWQQCECGKQEWGYWEFGGADNLMELNAKLSASCYFRKTKEEIQPYLPRFRREVVPFQIDRTEYDKVLEDFLAWLIEKKGLDAAERAYRAEAITRMNALKQIVAEEKVEQAAEWIGNLLRNEKVVVFTTHHATIDALREYLKGWGPIVIDGRVDAELREKDLNAFRASPNLKLALVNIRTGGVGIDLTVASHCVFVELDWTSTAHEQAESRLHRHGQGRPVTAWYLVGERTIDETILSVLERKRKIIAEVVDGKPGSGIPFDTEMEVANALKG